MRLFGKRWYVMRTDLYWVSHLNEERTYFGPFNSMKKAYNALGVLVNSDAKYDSRRYEYFVVARNPSKVYGVENESSKS